MTRPDIIRADTIDLQDRDAPTATRHQKPAPGGLLAPHQAETLREVAAETAEENSRSPRISWPSADSGHLQQYADDLTAASTLNGQPGGSANRMQTGSQQDSLAIAQNGGMVSHDVDSSDMDGDTDGDMDDDMMDKISSSPSIEDEDIDFEFVYALHTFVATVEGQANATKGDTMVLLDDSNSYWWLVRVVKDSSIGYLPAEHIETPTERLARLNKHRNIDLSATMLGDQAEKSRNPLKSAIKRRKKTVQFAAPQTFNYSDNDYSTEEEDLEAEYFAQQQSQQQQQQAQQTQEATAEDAEDETAKVEPLKPRSQPKDAKADAKRQEVDAAAGKGGLRTSEELFETRTGDGPKKTSDGTVRDSFFKDETVETKKITLTPNLLRDDNAGRSSNDSRDLKQRPSLDKLDKDNVFSKDDKKKKDKKEKDKKPSAIRSFFSRKDKRATRDEDDDSFGKRSLDADMQEREPEDEEPQSSPEKGQGPQRQPSKLQKQQPRAEPSPTRRPNGGTQKDRASMRATEPNAGDYSDGSPPEPRSALDQASRSPPSRAPPPVDTRPQKTTQAKARLELDDFDSDEEILGDEARQAAAPEEAPVAKEVPRQQPRVAQGSFSNGYQGPRAAPEAAQTIKVVPVNTTPPQQHVERLSESPVHVSPVTSSNPPPLMVDTSSQEEDRSSLRSSPSPSPELLDHSDRDMHGNKDSMTPTSSSTATSSWNDASLRAFFDSGSDIRDMLVVVYDKSDVEPVGPEHPVAGNLFKEPHAKLAEITTQLDNMLGDWLARKQRLRGTV